MSSVGSHYQVTRTAFERTRVRDEYPQLYAEEVPIVEKVGKNPRMVYSFYIYEVTIGEKTFSALSLPLLRNKLKAALEGIALVAATELPAHLKVAGECHMIRNDNGGNWLMAAHSGSKFYDRHANLVHVENGKLFPSIPAMSA